jgi:hypothetical protein
MSIMFAKLLLAASLLTVAAAPANAQTHYDTAPIPGAPPGFQRVVFTPVIDIANGYGKSACYTKPDCSRRYYDYLFVTPCPVGKPCGANGYYTKSFPSFASCPNGVPCGADTLDLTVGTQYSFFGNWIIEKYAPPCDICSCQDMTCFFGEDYATGTYPSNTPALHAGWGNLRVRYR